ncbi:MAG: hypothetical protein FWD37_03790, partial [Methanomassiliicoccaceae archaeon]|nr:hypothetical protein [Methanomassiliicoccaceae archaeon]
MKTRRTLAVAIAMIMVFSSLVVSVMNFEDQYDGGENNSLLNDSVVWGGPTDIADDFAGDGDGSEGNPYQISTPGELALLAKLVNEDDEVFNAGDKYYKLTTDLLLNDLTQFKEWGAGVVPDNPWTPIGDATCPFIANFDGGGHAVYGLYIDSTDSRQGLFGQVGIDAVFNKGTVRNVGVEKSYIYSENEGIGGVIGLFYGGTVESCWNGGSVTGGNNVGGVIGRVGEPIDPFSTGGNVTNCWNTGTINGADYVGGVVGNFYTNCGSIANCYNTGEITGGNNVGGVLGFTYRGIANCYNTGEITAPGSNVGGVAGESRSEPMIVAANCYSLETETINKGLPVVASGNKINASTFDEFGILRSLVYVSGAKWLSGSALIDVLNDLVEQARDDNYKEWVNPIFPVHEGTLDIKIWNGKTSDFRESEFTAGDGTVKNPYEISTPEQLAFLAKIINEGLETELNDSDVYYELTNDIYLNKDTFYNIWGNGFVPKNAWTPIGNSVNPFSANFDGKGFTVYGMYINTDKPHQGLFGYTNGADISNVGVDKSYVQTSSDEFDGYLFDGYAGGVIGYSLDSDIMNCWNTGKVIGISSAGGVIGRSVGGSITDCWNTGSITGAIVGGIVGSSDNTAITDCWNTGNFMSKYNGVGGIVGEIIGNTITGCWNAGNIKGDYARVGGIAGVLENSTINDCNNSGNIISEYYEAGGIVGMMSGGGSKVINCYNTGNVTRTDGTFGGGVGGLVGTVPSGSIENCYNTGNVTGINIHDTHGGVGGLVGIINGGNIENCYSTGNVTGDKNVGGVVGNASASDIVSYSYYLKTETINNPLYEPNNPSYGIGNYDFLSLSFNSSGIINGSAPDGKANEPLIGVLNGWSGSDPLYKSWYGTLFPTFDLALSSDSWDGEPYLSPDAPTFEFGNGTALDPYIISNAEDLASLSSYPFLNSTFNASGVYYALDADIYLNDVTDWESWDDEDTDDLNQWFPIGHHNRTATDPTPFKVNFDGKGHIIYGVYIPSGLSAQYHSYVGLFGYVVGGNISNVGVEKSYIRNGPSGSTGGVVSYLINGTVTNCWNTGKVIGNTNTGGVVGHAVSNTDSNSKILYSYNTGEIKGTSQIGGVVGFLFFSDSMNCYNTGSVTGSEWRVGGVVGAAEAGNILNCYNTGNVAGQMNIGGVVGSGSENSNIVNCYNTGDVYALVGYVGGVIGAADRSNITNSYNMGNVRADDVYAIGYVGGVAGGIENNSYITNSYNTGAVSSVDRIGGVVGFVGNNSHITNSYNTGDVRGVPGKPARVGGVVGDIENTDAESTIRVTNSYNTGNVRGYIAGGVVGYSLGGNVLIMNCYNIGNVDRGTNVGGVVGYMSDTDVVNCYNIGNVIGGDDAGTRTGGIAGKTINGSITNSYNTGGTDGHFTFTGRLVGEATNTIIGSSYYSVDETNGPIGSGAGHSVNNVSGFDAKTGDIYEVLVVDEGWVITNVLTALNYYVYKEGGTELLFFTDKYGKTGDALKTSVRGIPYAFTENEYYMVTFDPVCFDPDCSEHDAWNELFMEGLMIEEPELEHDDYEIIGWFVDGDPTAKWDFSTDTVNGDITLVAKWKRVSVKVLLSDSENAVIVSPSPPKVGFEVYGATIEIAAKKGYYLPDKETIEVFVGDTKLSDSLYEYVLIGEYLPEEGTIIILDTVLIDGDIEIKFVAMNKPAMISVYTDGKYTGHEPKYTYYLLTDVEINISVEFGY